jgi:TRAP-type uncharacterized transport system substrate-binding protein
MKRRLLMTALPALGLNTAANLGWAQTAPKPMVISSGVSTGTYYRLMKEFDQAAPGLIVNTTSDGSLTNIDRVIGNDAELGITQFDALYFRALKETNLRERIRILALLYPEEIHFIAKSAPRTEGGFGAFGIKTGIAATTVDLKSIDDLRGRKIGFWGGAVVTEQIVASMVLTGWMPVEYTDQKIAVEALRNDQIDALMAVGGQPLGWVSELSRDYKLLSVPDAVVARLTAVYDKTTLTYRNLGQEGVQTLAVPAMLVTRNYTSKSKHDQLQKLHDKFADAIGEIRETRGTHPKWGDINPMATTDRWPMYLRP